MQANASIANFVKTRAILASKHVHADAINESVPIVFTTDSHAYFSFDSVEDDSNNLYPLELINFVNPGGMPPR